MSETLIGTNIGRYKLIEETGHSEVVRVFNAHDARLERQVTLKLVTRSQEYSQNFSDYFLHEARGLAQLNHPNISKVLDFGHGQGYLYLVLEKLPDRSFADLVGKPVDWRSVIQLLLPVAQALAYAHQHEVIHRDLKPENIMLSAEDRPILCDFSITRIIEDEETREVTGTNAGLGSPAYMSPEQGKGMPVDYRADIYSLGIIFFELITGQPPFSAANNMETLIQQVIAPPPNPKKFVPDLPVGVEKIIMTALKKDPDERFQTMDDFLDSLIGVQNGKEFRKPRRTSTPHPVTRRLFLAFIIIALCAAGIIYIPGIILRKPMPGLAWLSLFPAPMTTPSQQHPTITLTPNVELTPTVEMTKTVNVAQPSSTKIPIAMVREFQEMPLLAGRAMTGLSGKIQTKNVSDLNEVMRLGNYPINKVVWSIDNASIIAATNSGIFFMDSNSLKIQGFFPSVSKIVTLALSKDGEMIAAGSDNGVIYIFDAMDGAVMGTLVGHEDIVTAVAFSNDGKRLVSGSTDKSVRVWDLRSGSQILELKKHSLAVNTVVYSNNGDWVISGSDDFHAIIWDVNNGTEIDDIRFEQKITQLALSRDDSVLAVGLINAKVELWSLEKNIALRVLQDSKQVTKVTTLSFSPNQSLIASGAEDGIVRVWNVNSGSQLWDLVVVNSIGRPLTDGDTVIDSAFSGDGTRLITIAQNGVAKIWDMANQEISAQLDSSRGQPVNVEFSNDNKLLLVEFDNQQVQIWSVDTGTLLSTLTAKIPKGSIFSSDNKMAALWIGENLNIVTLAEGNNLTTKVVYGFTPTNYVSFLPDNKILAASNTRSVTLWSVATGLEIDPETYKYEKNCRVAYSKDGEFIAAGSAFGLVLNPEVYSTLCEVNRNPWYVSSSISNNGDILVQGLQLNSVEVWRASGEISIQNMTEIGKGKVKATTLSPDGQLLAATSEDEKVVVIDLNSMTLLKILDHHTDDVNDVTFSNDGKMLATCSADGTIQIWGIPVK